MKSGKYMKNKVTILIALCISSIASAQYSDIEFSQALYKIKRNQETLSGYLLKDHIEMFADNLATNLTKMKNLTDKKIFNSIREETVTLSREWVPNARDLDECIDGVYLKEFEKEEILELSKGASVMDKLKLKRVKAKVLNECESEIDIAKEKHDEHIVKNIGVRLNKRSQLEKWGS